MALNPDQLLERIETLEKVLATLYVETGTPNVETRKTRQALEQGLHVRMIPSEKKDHHGIWVTLKCEVSE